jgi:hypothetical protein
MKEEMRTWKLKKRDRNREGLEESFKIEGKEDIKKREQRVKDKKN